MALVKVYTLTSAPIIQAGNASAANAREEGNNARTIGIAALIVSLRAWAARDFHQIHVEKRHLDSISARVAECCSVGGVTDGIHADAAIEKQEKR